jgi:hypothetical protein
MPYANIHTAAELCHQVHRESSRDSPRGLPGNDRGGEKKKKEEKKELMSQVKEMLTENGRSARQRI